MVAAATPRSHHSVPIADFAMKNGLFNTALWCIDHKFYHTINNYYGLKIFNPEFCKASSETQEKSQKQILLQIFHTSNEALLCCAKMNNLNLLDWAYSQKFPHETSENICSIASGHGNIDMIIWARNRNFHWDTDVCATAAAQGQMETLQYLHKGGCPWNSRTCGEAAMNGHFTILKWCISQGCPWEGSCAYAAEGGQLEILQWLRSEGCPWDEWTCLTAAAKGKLETLQWSYFNGCPQPPLDHICMEAAEKGFLPIIKWAHELGWKWSRRISLRAAECGHMDIVRWLHEVGCPETPSSAMAQIII